MSGEAVTAPSAPIPLSASSSRTRPWRPRASAGWPRDLRYCSLGISGTNSPQAASLRGWRAPAPAFSGSELDDVGALPLPAEDHDPVFAICLIDAQRQIKTAPINLRNSRLSPIMTSLPVAASHSDCPRRSHPDCHLAASNTMSTTRRTAMSSTGSRSLSSCATANSRTTSRDRKLL
jgi:hypothetical protein